MGFWNKVGKVVGAVIDHAPEVIGALQQEAAKKQASLQKEADRRIKEHERKVTQAEKSNRMSDPDFARKVKEEKEKLNTYYNRGSQSKNASGEATYKGLTVSQWNQKWIRLGVLSSLTLEDLSRYNKHIGLYKAEMNGQVVYLGRAIEYNNGGFRKRLRDYVRNSDSARTHGSGQKMNENRDRVQISILIVGSSAEDVETVKALERAMISHLNVRWNVQHNR
ncbi:hypothetical protein E1I69_13115 [Bacillus timonensis]|uniref:Uncharacterized protein n=1 Tax=Bacillus timonensis TaxID=1033734 RepID=A0A4S3PRQ8_9BACI|nr:hypothetical protein [Bacillus timonensis]THE11946.1 hypothetical protein E1I69_13115 [Bacillus timonensis]